MPGGAYVLLFASFLVLTGFRIRGHSILPKKELHRSLLVITLNPKGVLQVLYLDAQGNSEPHMTACVLRPGRTAKPSDVDYSDYSLAAQLRV